ncbi:putative transcriptional regulator, AsnC family [Vulcanisaeta moutnovskia 768-28]|uniref:siroheme decarboxylase n=1 Tax=Vulcanisaeta moutnovskia (strain 768-28) TaxID=985053 RepID=F0QUR4_VULM7|nr:Lrp/AsnC family transcriptional regulator [Vulcanisaeta moutnovskia]ADY00725.1 putative transcriptional regulator, AsnC family [Vulcanisaeta moutnovskia 768-28]
MELDTKLRSLLMELQYSFPIVKRPFLKIANRLNEDEDWVLEKTRDLFRNSVIKRIGALVNYRSRGLVSALVGVNVPSDLINDVAKAINSDAQVSHNFVREHPRYNVWFVTKARSREELIMKVSNTLSKFSINDFVILTALRTYKIDVKFDLMSGVSRTKSMVLPLNVPSIESAGLSMEFFRRLRSINIVREPFNEIASLAGTSVDELGNLLDNLMRIGVIRDFYAALDSDRVGFRENAMVVFKATPETCERTALIEETTHVVLREVTLGSWPYNCYFMIHGINRNVLEDAIGDIMRRLGVNEYETLYSTRNLLPEMPRRLELTSM